MTEIGKPRKSWGNKYLKLSVRFRRIINNFMGTRMDDGNEPDKNIKWSVYEMNKANWINDCRSYSAPFWLMDSYHAVRKNFIKFGRISEEVDPFPNAEKEQGN